MPPSTALRMSWVPDLRFHVEMGCRSGLRNLESAPRLSRNKRTETKRVHPAVWLRPGYVDAGSDRTT